MSKPILIFCMFVFLGACTPRTYDMKKYEIWVGLGLDETPKEEFVVLSPLKWNKIHNVSRLQIKVSDIEFYKIYEKFVSASKTECGFLDCCFLVMQVKRNNELLEYLTIHHPVVDLNIVGKDDAGADMGYGIRSLELTSLFYKTLRQEIDKYELDFSSLNLTESEEQKIKDDFEDYKNINFLVPDEGDSVLKNTKKIREKRKLKVLFKGYM